MQRGWPSGPRLPGGGASPSDRRIADPGKGERVPRCAVCGLPNTAEMRGTWGGMWGRLPICERDWFRFNPPDPLDVQESA